MTKSYHPLYLELNILALKLERGLLSADELAKLSVVLRRLAKGETFDQIVGLNRNPNRPNLGKTELYIEQVYGLTRSTWNGKAGLKVTEAIREVAKKLNVSDTTVKTAYYSETGRAFRKKVVEAYAEPTAVLSRLLNED